MITSILILFLLLSLSAFFSSAETAYTAVHQVKLRHLTKEHPEVAQDLEYIYKNPRSLITSLLVGNNFVNVATATYSTKLCLDFLSQFAWGTFALSLSVITILITIVLLIFGEITPKTIAFKNADKVVVLFAKPVRLFLTIMYPVIFIFDSIADVIRKLFNISDVRDQLFSIEEVRTLVEIGREEGGLEKEKNNMLRNVFNFSETIVREIMTPRTDAICLSISSSVQDAIELITHQGHSRIPIFEDRVDNVIGVIYAKDLLCIPSNDHSKNIQTYMRSAIFIPETKPIADLLEQMKKSRFHLAIAVDEYGGMAGLVTLEDIIEEIIGEIEDEYDAGTEIPVISIGEQSYLVDAQINIESLMDEIKVSFEEISDDYDTLGGFVLAHLGRFPGKGEHFEFKNLKFTIQEIRKQRIKKVRIDVLEITSTED